MDVQISTRVLRDTASKVRDINAKLDNALLDINKEMNDLEAFFDSDSGREIRANMNALKPRFEQYKNVVASYVDFLTRTAERYEGTEAANESNAQQFRR